MMNMKRREILCTTYGEMLDMISCLAIYNGAEPAQSPSTVTSVEETMEVI